MVHKAGKINPRKPIKVNDMPPILKYPFFFINENAVPCITLPKVKIIPQAYSNVLDASLNSSANIKIKNKGAYSIKLPCPRIALSKSFESICLSGL